MKFFTSIIYVKYLRYVLHGIWCTKMPKVVGALFFVIRMSLLFKMVFPLIYNSKLPDSAKKDIQNQVRQVLAYYMGQYVHMVKEDDHGIKSREATKKKASNKKSEEDSDKNYGLSSEEKKEPDSFQTPTLKPVFSGGSSGNTKSKGKGQNTEEDEEDANFVKVDLSKITAAQAKFVNNCAQKAKTVNNVQPGKRAGRPKRNSTETKSEVAVEDAATNAKKRKGSGTQGNKKSPASNKKAKSSSPEKGKKKGGAKDKEEDDIEDSSEE